MWYRQGEQADKMIEGQRDAELINCFDASRGPGRRVREAKGYEDSVLNRVS